MNNIFSSKKIEEDDVEILESAINLLGGKRRFGILIGKHEIDKKQLKDYFIYDLSLYEGKPRLDIIRVDEVIDPFDNKVFIFNDCVSLLSLEIIEENIINNNKEENIDIIN